MTDENKQSPENLDKTNRKKPTLTIVPSVKLKSKKGSLEKWDQIRREESRFDQSQYEGAREKFYQEKERKNDD